jgi:hypothetical protein
LKNLTLAALGFCAALLGGCATQNSLYYWGGYEEQIHTMYYSPDKAAPELQIIKLEAIIEKAKAAGKPLPPGFHAHLGYEYAISGKKDLAFEQFTLEKQQYPESTVYMDLLIKQLKPKQDKPNEKV